MKERGFNDALLPGEFKKLYPPGFQKYYDKGKSLNKRWYTQDFKNNRIIKNRLNVNNNYPKGFDKYIERMRRIQNKSVKRNSKSVKRNAKSVKRITKK